MIDRDFAPIVNLCPACAPAFLDVRRWMAKASPATRSEVRDRLIRRCVKEHTAWHSPPWKSRAEIVYADLDEDGWPCGDVLALRYAPRFIGRHTPRTWVGDKPITSTTTETK